MRVRGTRSPPLQRSLSWASLPPAREQGSRVCRGPHRLRARHPLCQVCSLRVVDRFADGDVGVASVVGNHKRCTQLILSSFEIETKEQYLHRPTGVFTLAKDGGLYVPLLFWR